MVADVCIYPQDQLQPDQRHQDQFIPEGRQRNQLRLEQLERSTKLEERHQAQHQHEVCIYPDLDYSRSAATEVSPHHSSLTTKMSQKVHKSHRVLYGSVF